MPGPSLPISALIITGWDEFKRLKAEHFLKLMKNPAVDDGRRIYDPRLFSPEIRFKAIGLGKRLS